MLHSTAGFQCLGPLCRLQEDKEAVLASLGGAVCKDDPRGLCLIIGDRCCFSRVCQLHLLVVRVCNQLLSGVSLQTDVLDVSMLT